MATCARLQTRIGERFPGSGLHRVSGEVEQIAQNAIIRCEKIHRPQIALRVIIGMLMATMVGLIASVVPQLRIGSDIFDANAFLQLVGSLVQTLFYVGLAILFIVTLETRLKRARALKAFRELRAIAHIADMHQLTKDPERILRSDDATVPLQAGTRMMTKFEMGRYLDYCSELLSMIGKIGAMYVQEFPDAVALDAADHLAQLTNDLGRNIWQKIMILDLASSPDSAGAPPSDQPTPAQSNQE